MKTSKKFIVIALLAFSMPFLGFVKDGKPATPTATIDGIQTTDITIARLQTLKEVKLETTSQDGALVTYKVNRFTFAIAPLKSTDGKPAKNSSIMEISGSQLTPDAKNLLKTVNPGDLIIIGNIKATGPDGNEIAYKGMTYKAIGS